MDPIQEGNQEKEKFRSDLIKVSFERLEATETQSREITPFKTLLKRNEAGNIQGGMGE